MQSILFKQVSVLLAAVSLLVGCSKLVDVPPPSNATVISRVFENDASALAAVNEWYASMSAEEVQYGASLPGFMSVFAGLAADEFKLVDGANEARYTEYYTNSLTSVPNVSPQPWLYIYPLLYRVNQAIEGLSVSTGTTLKLRNQLLGEAYFMRAFNYFHLVNLYGPVPLVLGTDYTVNAKLGRTRVDSVYAQINSDLDKAVSLMGNNYLNPDAVTTSGERTAPNKWVAQALRARVQLYLKHYSEAAAAASAVIDDAGLYDLLPPGEVFQKNSLEAIWQLQPVNTGLNTEDGKFFVIPEDANPNEHAVALSDDLLSAFEAGDIRQTAWTGTVNLLGTDYSYAFKYKEYQLDAPLNEYEMVMRLAEQYLIRAEASVYLNNLPQAVADLNKIRERAGLDDYSGLETPEALIDAIAHERRIEFFAEWGHRWLDLKRTDKVNSIMSAYAPVKSATWNDYDQWCPVPLSEIRTNPFLEQTDGY